MLGREFFCVVFNWVIANHTIGFTNKKNVMGFGINRSLAM
jgi:hypothetical protein